MSSQAIPNQTGQGNKATPPRTRVKAKDRLKFTIFMAVCIHLIIILGIRFTLPETKPSQIPLSLDVTLAQRESLQAPEKADFIGQKNQEGAGDASEANRPTTKLEHFKNTEGETTTPSMEVMPKPNENEQELDFMTSTDSDRVAQISDDPNESPTEKEQQTIISPDPEELKKRNLEQDAKDQLQTRGLRKRQISAAVKQSPTDAAYLESWRRKVEEVGNLHYPEQASRLGIYGNLKLKVAIDKDGQLVGVEILESSGQDMLDQAALQIVRLAAPFDPLPESIRQTTDILEIVRSWKFEKSPQ
ncbi:energy transducer TonB [Kangiella sediminilitoris]|uniref:TonB family protein n=1 Tax=Kangiella sediminilitoris TaxID=1144748 RepID=A0A1B3BDM1_9GAMM|nr:energy transducer TonB [Kangiella sediminilitoris]AOE50875.1 TonB family protein [Kangiella sediminilitoris]